MTPSVARMIAARQQETAFPARWFSIANFMRYERPQNGREREFWQLNADLFGINSAEADIEIITLADRILKRFGAQPKMYTIKVNHRRLIDFMMKDYLGLDVVQSQLMTKLFDKKNKIPAQDFKDKVIEIFEPAQVDEGLQKIASLFAAKTVKEFPQQIRQNEIFIQLTDLFEQLRENGVKSVQFDISLMRGLDYYNGVVFEVFDNHPDNNRAMFGGGRYDGLTTLFGAENVPVVGFAPGATTTELFLRSHNLLPTLSSRTELYIAVLGEESLAAAKNLADNFREEKVRVEIDITGRKLDKQIKTASKKAIEYVLFVGENELKSGQYSLKNLESGKEQKLSFERIVAIVKDTRSSNLY